MDTEPTARAADAMAADPKNSTKPGKSSKPRKSPWRAILIGFGVTAVLGLGAIIGVRWYVGKRIRSGAEERGLTVEYRSLEVSPMRVALRDVVVKPRTLEGMELTVAKIDVPLSGLSPTQIVIDSPKLTLVGDIAHAREIYTSLVKRQTGVDETPSAPAKRLPVLLENGTLHWEEPLGEGTALNFERIRFEITPKTNTTAAKFTEGSLDLGFARIEQLMLRIDTRPGSGKGQAVGLDFSMKDDAGGAIAIGGKADDGDGEFRIGFDGFDLAHLKPGKKKLPFKPKGKASGEGTATWTSAGIVESKGSLHLDHLAVPAVSISGKSIAIGSSVALTWKGSPKKGHPWTMVLEEAKLETTILGAVRTATATGEISIGERGHGPYVGSFSFELSKLRCEDIASLVAGSFAAGVTAGNVTVRGKLEFDTEKEEWKPSVDIKQDCRLDALKGLASGLGSLLK